MLDEKAAFYFRHREQIEEWAALRDEARSALEDELRRRAATLQTGGNADVVIETADLEGRGQWPRYMIARPDWLRPDKAVDAARVSVALEWVRGQLLGPTRNTWPYVGIRVPANQPDVARLRQSLKSVLTVQAQLLGWTANTNGFWIWWKYLTPSAGPFDLDAYADHCVVTLERGWSILEEPIAAVVRDHLHTSGETQAREVLPNEH